MSRMKQSTLPKYYFANSRKDPIPNWRIRINQTQLVSQASSIILQRHTKLWGPLLKSLKLSSELTPSIFHQILNKIQTQPEICFSFFNWVQKNFAFKPDLKSQCELTRILLGSGSEFSKLGNPILNSITEDNPPTMIVPKLIQSRKGDNFLSISPVLNSVFKCYCNRNMYFHCLEVYQMAKNYGVVLTVSSCNSLLNSFIDKDELRLAWCFYASMTRNGIAENELTWSLIARVLYKDGKFERISKILDLEIYTSAIFDLMIEGYSERGDFESALSYLTIMCSKKIELSFSTYSAILNGACKYQNKEVIENVTRCMLEKGFLSESRVPNYDSIIEKLCNLGKTYVVDLFFKRASGEKIELLHVTYECMFRVLLSEEGRLNDAIEMYNVMQEKNVMINEKCYNEFINVLSNENPTDEISKLLIDVTRRGSGSSAMEVSGYISKLCVEGQWREGIELLNSVMDQKCLLDSVSNGYFVKHFCSIRRIDSAIMLHDKLVGLKGNLDTGSYNVFLAALFKEKRIDEAVKVFAYMKMCGVLSIESFTLMIKGLCREKEMRKAMKLHDEMLELGLKPDRRSYTRLISGFK